MFYGVTDSADLAVVLQIPVSRVAARNMKVRLKGKGYILTERTVV